MILLQATRIHRAFITNVVLESVNFTLQDRRRVGLVGVNGSGKSTLLRILAGLDTPDSGELYYQKGLRIGYHAQLDELSSKRTIWQEMESVYVEVFAMEARLREIEGLMGETQDDPAAYDRLAQEYDRLTNAYEQADGYAWQANIRGVLAGLGFTQRQHEQAVDSLSGGERTRVKLAQLLLTKPDILLLDEPTNHLDLDATAWLEGYLRSFSGSVVVVSHDRYFLDAVCTDVAEMSLRTLTQYEGNYTEYMEKRSADFERRMKEYAQQQKYIEREKVIIARYRSFATEKAIRRAQSREKRLEKVERVERPQQEKISHFSFRIRRSTGVDVLLAENLSMGYDGRMLFENVNIHLRAGDRVAIIGPNGVGKTTLLRVLLGRETPLSGSVRFGAGVEVGYYDQQQRDLDEEKSVLDEVWDAFPRMEQTEIRNALGGFLLTGDDVFQPIHTLSGGERGRLLLTKLMLRMDNLLILDEPTNHLDMDSRGVLEDALLDFDGTILAVSHDRFFINRLFDRVLVLDRNGITEYLGNYDDYQEKLKAANSAPEEAASTRTKTAIREEKRKEREMLEAARQAKRDIAALEERIHNAEAELAGLEKRMAEPDIYMNPEESRRLSDTFRNLKSELESLYEQWAQAAE